MYNMDIIEQAKLVLDIEAEAIKNLKISIDHKFKEVVDLLSEVKGRVFLSGIGKSGLIARKISATLSSTGTPALFIHPTECFHGDAGIISKDDVGVLLSNSGETDELVEVIPVFKRLGVKLVAITGRKESTLAKRSDYVIVVPIEKEACPMGIVPTASTTAMLALGDAIAVSLLIKKGFSQEDFAKLHPGGTLGRRLLVRVKDIMHVFPRVPIVVETATMRETLIEMTSKSLGITGVVDSEGFLIGAVTDGDLRRHMERSRSFLDDSVTMAMGKNPKTISEQELAVDALNVMEKFKITHIFVSDPSAKTKDGKIKPTGILHIHNILGAKII
jgi:arabinose-5-phosphate isomerase